MPTGKQSVIIWRIVVLSYTGSRSSRRVCFRLPDPKYMTVLWSFDVSVTIYKWTWHSNPNKLNLQWQCCENLESHDEEEVQKGRFLLCMPWSHITRADVEQHSFSTLALRCRWAANFTSWMFSHKGKSFKHPIHSNYTVQNAQNIISDSVSLSPCNAVSAIYSHPFNLRKHSHWSTSEIRNHSSIVLYKAYQHECHDLI